jgi:SAM-dependent methyltransferase
MDAHGRLFNRIAFFYQWRTPFQIRKYRKYLKDHKILNKIPSKGTILDIGAGTGAFGYIFKELGYEVLEIDVAPRMIQMCKRNGLKGKVWDIVESGIPFRDDSFDLVIAAQFFHGLNPEKRNKLYKESQRVSKNGRVLLYEYNVRRKNNLKARFLEWIEGGYYHNFREHALEELNSIFSMVDVFEINNNNAYYFCSSS